MTGLPSDSLAQLNSSSLIPLRLQKIHQEALAATSRYRAAEIDLINILEAVEKHRVFLHYGFNSVFQYAVQGLGLSENVAYTFINVARKAREVPALKEEIKLGNLSVSKARKITSVLTQENKDHWIALAKTSSQAVVEREVAKVNPLEAARGRANYVHPLNEIKEKVVIPRTAPRESNQAPAPARVQLQVGISEKLIIKLRRAQDLVSQKSRKGATLEDTLEALIGEFLEKHDPVEKAKRQLVRGKLSATADEVASGGPNRTAGRLTAGKHEGQMVKGREGEEGEGDRREGEGREVRVGNCKTKGRGEDEQFLRQVFEEGASKRKPICAKKRHRLMLKFAGRCSHVDQNGNRCPSTRFLEIHHLKPLRLGGSDDLENLTLLCAGHHRGRHLDGR